MKQLPLIALLLLLVGCSTTQKQTLQTRERWTEEQANSWYAKQPWLVGCNFSPSTAINQLEMWQAETWDPKTINRELGWAADLGFTSVRVYLHEIPWQQDRNGFLKRVDQFLSLADKHKIGVMLVLFDSVWDPYPKPGKQRAPRPHVHNSGWVQSPGADILGNPARHDELKPYVQDVISHFRNDRRVQVWDIFNEPENDNPAYRNVELKNKFDASLALLKKSFEWAREVNPSQPITSGVWIGNWSDPAKLTAVERVQLEESDIITFHNYSDSEAMKKCVENLQRYNRPILCTEYMARPNKSRFDPILGYMKEQNVGAYNWGFVDGKTQTIYPWDSWTKKYTAEPPEWFHDILRRDGTPYREAEVQYLKSLTRDARKQAERRRKVSQIRSPQPAELLPV
ncbi:MAG: cellulase family glycosylhydrolase [Verrucomicrobia bacterium]|nr:cellulase family glycosylhydrolase [Verrucomicrobiota bacterium]